jgi:RHS repeat-associated protein
VLARQWYHPFGTVRASSGALPTDITFTAQRAENGLGSLMDFRARMYSPLIGRFISADSIVPEPGNPQALNRYSYAYNSPLNYIDPSGHTSVCANPAMADPECDPNYRDKWTSPSRNLAPPWKTYSGDDPFSAGYDPDSDSIPDWGQDQSEVWRQMRAERVWGWICSSGGWWGSGCPSPKQLTAWLLWQEGGWLYNPSVVDPNVNTWSNIVAGRRAMVGIMAYLFGDGNITAADLSTFTAFFNPDSGSAFTNRDWAELTTSPPPPPDWFAEVDLYWDQGPYMDNGRRVDRWWTSAEAVQCTQCVIAFSVDISPLGDGRYGALIHFGYLP